MQKITVEQARQARADYLVTRILNISANASDLVWLLSQNLGDEHVASLMNRDRIPNFELKKAEDFSKLKTLQEASVVITLELLVASKLVHESEISDDGIQCSECGTYHKELVELTAHGDRKYQEDHNTIQICVDCGIKALEVLS